MHSIRRLNSSDVVDFRKLLNLFGEVFEEPDTYQKKQPNDHYLRELLGKSTFLAVIASLEEEIVGGLTAYILDKFEQERREIYIYDLAVAKEYRRQKIATRLILHLRELSQELEVYQIFVQADQGDTPAIRLYESLGVKEDVHHFDINMVDRSSGF